MVRDINGYVTFGLPFTDTKVNTTLASNEEQTTTVPASPDATFKNILAVFSFTAGASVWVANNATAATPGGSFASTTSELNPAARQVKSGDILHFITADDTNDQVGITYYAF